MMAAHLTRVLKDYTVRIFSNGIEAMAAIDQQIPDLILLDIILDGPSGFALIAELQSYTDTAAVPVIICSSVASELGEYAASQAVRVLDKTTMTPDDIRDAAREALK